MAVFSSKNNYICGAFFTGKSFLVLEFDNRKGKKTVRTKGEIEATAFLGEDFSLSDKVKAVEAAKKIRKNTKSNSICINKSLNGKDLTHLFEIFSVAGFEDVRFAEIEETLNNSFRRDLIEGEEMFLLIEDGIYKLYISYQDKIELVSTADSLGDIDLSKKEIKDRIEEASGERIKIFGLDDFEDFSRLEDKLHSFGYKAVLGNVWQNAFSVSSHIPSIHHKDSSRYAVPIALALHLSDSKKEEDGEYDKKSISDDLYGKVQEIERDNSAKEDKVEENKEPIVLEEFVIETEEVFSTSIDLPILEKDSENRVDGMSTYIPTGMVDFFDDLDSFEEIEMDDLLNIKEEAKLDDEIKINEEEAGETEEPTEPEELEEELKEDLAEDVLLVEDDIQEGEMDMDIVEDILMEEEIVEEVEVHVVEDSKVVEEKVEQDEVDVPKEKKSSPAWLSWLSWSTGSNNKKEQKVSSVSRKKKRKKKSKNAKKHKKKK